MIDPQLFGLTQDIEVKFFTPEEASKIRGVSSGYNAVYVIGDGRVRYELLKAGKAIFTENELPLPVSNITETPKATRKPKKEKQL